ncbi:hypothetical protein A2U01_0083926, partial [Trifolium medium]|nr:hypothetical protein [Trifolium medium]
PLTRRGLAMTAKIRQRKFSTWRDWAKAGEHLATCRQSSPGDLSRTRTVTRARYKARLATCVCS